MIVDKTSFHSEFYFECLVTTLPLKKEAQFVASDVVAFRSQRSHANYCNHLISNTNLSPLS